MADPPVGPLPVQAPAIAHAVAAAEACGDWDLALSGYRLLLSQQPCNHVWLCNAARACWYLDRPHFSLQLYCRALRLRPQDPVPWLGLANALRDLNRYEAADSSYRRSRSLAPSAISAWNHSQLLLGLQRYAEAYGLAEERATLPELEPYRPIQALPQPLDPARLCLWSEQGFGDTFQYLRWCVALAQAGAPLMLELEAPLAALAQEGLRWLGVPLAVQVKQPDPPPLAVGVSAASLLSLPHHLGGAPLGHLFEPTRRAGVWQGYLRSDQWPLRSPSTQPRVGLVWASGRKLDHPFTAREYRKRSLPEPALAHLIQGLHSAGAVLVDLQFGPDRALANPWRHHFPLELPPDATFALNAQWIRQLDLLISVDTASAHLAGALGHPCWVVLPFSADPRWLRHRSDSPWYPSLRLFRQPATGQWEPVIDAVLEAFRAWWPSVAGS